MFENGSSSQRVQREGFLGFAKKMGKFVDEDFRLQCRILLVGILANQTPDGYSQLNQQSAIGNSEMKIILVRL